MPLDLNVFDEDRFMGVDELAKNDLLVTLTLSLSLALTLTLILNLTRTLTLTLTLTLGGGGGGPKRADGDERLRTGDAHACQARHPGSP